MEAYSRKESGTPQRSVQTGEKEGERMKRFLLLCLALALTVSLCACGGTNDPAGTASAGGSPQGSTAASASDPMDSAEQMSTSELGEIERNIAKGLQYKDTYQIIRGIVISIHTEYCEVAPFYEYDGRNVYGEDFLILYAYLSTENLVSLETGKKVSVVGHISDVDEKEFTLMAAGGDAGAFGLGSEFARTVITMDECRIAEVE